MESRNRRVIRITWRAVLGVVVLSAVLLFLCVKGVLPWPHRVIELRKIRATEGFGFTAKLPVCWPGFVFVSESAVMTEDGRALNRVNENGSVREQGSGRFRAGGERVLFSTSDGTDPLTNWRRYAITLDTAVAPKIRLPILLGGAIAGLLLFGKHLRSLAAWMRRAVPAVSAQSWALALFAAALAVRVGFLWMNPDYTDEKMSIRGVPFSDARDWHWMSRSTATGGGVDATYPGMRALYPMFLANFYTWFGDSVMLAKALQAMIGAASAALVFLALRRAMPTWPAVAAALFFAFDPRQVTQAGTLMTEPLGLLLMMLCAWCMMVGGERRRPAMLFASGAFLACSNLSRPLTLFAFPICVGIIAANSWLRESRRWRAAVLHSAAFVLGTVVFLAPWVIRQRVVHGIWTISCNSSSALFAASTPEFGVWRDGVESLPKQAGIPRNVKARHDYFTARFRENLNKYPGFYASNIARSFGVAAMSGANFSPQLRGAGLGALAIVGVAFTLWWRAFPAAVLIVCHFGGLLGSALFGNPDIERVRLLIDWVEAGWMFAGVFAIGSAAVALLIRIPLREMLGASRESDDETPRPWLRWLGWGFAGFLLVSSGRLVFLNVFTPPPPTRKPLQFSDEERTALLQDFATRFPAWQRIADPALMTTPRGWERRAFVEFGAMEEDVYRFPANVGFQHSSGLFVPRPYAHSGLYFRGARGSFASIVWVEFAGDVPPALRAAPCLLIGLSKSRPTLATYVEHSIEAVAIIPAPDYKPDMTRALIAPVFPETRTLIEAPAPPQ